MNDSLNNLPFVALVDDDQYSAHLLTRTLLAQGSPEIAWYGDAADGRRKLGEVLADPNADWPGLLVVDLKAHSRANIEFLMAMQTLLFQKGIPVAVMAPPLDQQGREALLAAGASVVFCRHAERDAYRREAAGIISFWARGQRLDAVGM